MAKFYGKIGFSNTTETAPDVWSEGILEKEYYGDLIRNSRRLEGSGSINDNVTISNEVSILADPYAYENFHAIRYVEFLGSKWKVSNIEVQYPRLILTLGGLYNEQTS